MMRLTARSVRSSRHTTNYWESGPDHGPLMVFLHGWPGSGLMWRAQIEAFASEGWRCVAPGMRGYGGSSAPSAAEAYALHEIVGDIVELHDHLGARPAIWVGHDWGSPVAGALAAHHAARSRGVVLISLPYFPEGFALPNLLPLIDRALYPTELYPDGQWDYYRFYLAHFDQTVSDMDADIPATLASLYRPGNPASAGTISPSALLTRNAGRYGAAHRAPPTVPDPTLWPPADFASLAEAFRHRGFRPANAWYLNDAANIAYARAAPDGGRLRQPVLFINGDWDAICDINRGRLGEPMRSTCQDLVVTGLPAGHWLPLERKAEVVEAIRAWLDAKGLSQPDPRERTASEREARNAMSSNAQQSVHKFLAIGTSKPMTPEQRKDHMLAEITATLQLYLDGRIDQFWHRYDGKGVVFVMTTGSIEEADALLKALPLGVAGILSFELIPIGPLRPINALLEAAELPPLVAIRKEVG